MASSLLPRANEYWKAGFNVLLIGKHGVGKTAIVQQLAEDTGIVAKYFSCATLEPFTHFVGVPHAYKDDKGRESLKLIRPRDVDDAELVFLDELNRADDTVLNAVLEIVQFHTINGEPLPKLRAVWAAINPPEGEYKVHELDPALVDRFDIYEELKPKPNAKYLSARIQEAVAAAGSPVSNASCTALGKVLVEWHQGHDATVSEDHPENYISPRRLEKIGTVVAVLNSASQVRKLIPPGAITETNKLQDMLTKALNTNNAVKIVNGEDQEVFGPNSQIKAFTSDWLFKNLEIVRGVVQDVECTDETKEKISEAISGATGADRWVAIAQVLIEAGMEPKYLQKSVFSFSDVKQDEISQKVDYNSALDKAIWDYS